MSSFGTSLVLFSARKEINDNVIHGTCHDSGALVALSLRPQLLGCACYSYQDPATAGGGMCTGLSCDFLGFVIWFCCVSLGSLTWIDDG